jgi:hypothetical protein
MGYGFIFYDEPLNPLEGTIKGHCGGKPIYLIRVGITFEQLGLQAVSDEEALTISERFLNSDRGNWLFYELPDESFHTDVMLVEFLGKDKTPREIHVFQSSFPDHSMQ